MAADIIIDEQTVELHGDIVAMDTFTTKGNLAGYYFHDRHIDAIRFAWYADLTFVRLWTDFNSNAKNILTIDAFGNFLCSDQMISVTGMYAGFEFFDRDTYLGSNKIKFAWYAHNGMATLQNSSSAGAKDIMKITQNGNFFCKDKEIMAEGALAGFAFSDRSDASKRYVWYADKDKVRLWSDKDNDDILTIEKNSIVLKYSIEGKEGPTGLDIKLDSHIDLLKTLLELKSTIPSKSKIVADSIRLKHADAVRPEGDPYMDVAKTIAEMQTNIAILKTQVMNLQALVGSK